MVNEKQMTFPHEDPESLNAFYGDPRGKGGKASTKWYNENIVKWKPPYPLFYSDGRIPLKTLQIHKKCVEAFDGAFQEVAQHFSEDEIEEKRLNISGGTYNYRLMRGGSKLSLHAYGATIDIDPENNPYPHPWTDAGIDKDFVAILENHGFYWRGTNGDIDPMHFQCAYRGQKVARKPIHPSPGLVIPEEQDKTSIEDEDTPTTIYHYFVNAGLTPEQACGIVANVEAESGFDIHNIGDGGRAKGIFQMHPDRRGTIKDATGIDMAHDSIIDQCKGVFWELQNVELVAYRKLKEAEKPFQAGYAWCRYYERPASHYEWIKRGKRAQHWYEHFTK